MNKELIEERLYYLVENFETIQKLVEKEKARPKSVFGWKANGAFNKTGEDILWGSDVPAEIDPNESEQVTTEEVESTSTSKGTDLDSPSESKPTKTDLKDQRESEGAMLPTKTESAKSKSKSNPWHKHRVTTTNPMKVERKSQTHPNLVKTEPTSCQSTIDTEGVKLTTNLKEINDVTPTNDSPNSDTPNNLLRDKDKELGGGSSVTPRSTIGTEEREDKTEEQAEVESETQHNPERAMLTPEVEVVRDTNNAEREIRHARKLLW